MHCHAQYVGGQLESPLTTSAQARRPSDDTVQQVQLDTIRRSHDLGAESSTVKTGKRETRDTALTHSASPGESLPICAVIHETAWREYLGLSGPEARLPQAGQTAPTLLLNQTLPVAGLDSPTWDEAYWIRIRQDLGLIPPV